MFWGITMPNDLMAIKIMEGKQDSEKYINLFKDFTVLIMNLNFRKGYRIFHDNCLIRVSMKFKLYWETQSFEVMEWPARSPDLNFMENVWKMISDIVYDDCKPQTKQDLANKIHNTVFKINCYKKQTIIDLHNNSTYILPKLLLCKGNIIN